MGGIMKNKLKKYINNTQDPYVNAELAYEYEKIDQGAPAVSFYTRAAELSYKTDKILAYCCILKTFNQLEKTGGRDKFCKGQLFKAIDFMPERPEAYYLLAMWYSWRRDWLQSNYWIKQGIKCFDNNKFDALPYTVREELDIHVLKPYEQQLQFTNWAIGEGEKIDIVLQGKYSDYVLETANHYLELDFVNNIIISCWKGDDLPVIKNNRIKVVYNTEPKNPGTGQRNLQIVSSLNGIIKATTNTVIKMRNDQRYTLDSMYKMNDFYKRDGRIYVAGNFKDLLYHPRDHIFWGQKDSLIKLFDIPLENWALQDVVKLNHPGEYALYYDKYIRTETYIGAHYAAKHDHAVDAYLQTPHWYLYDNASKWNEAKKHSDDIMPKLFKTFPREGIELAWPKYFWKKYPYDNQKDKFGEVWHEDEL
jgi:hypothetical protein